MESFLWAVNLCAVVYLCFWAIREDTKDKIEKNLKKESTNLKGKR